MDGVSGLKALGVRELNYKLLFVAQYISSFSGEMSNDED
jgi:hypothetical protein